MEEYVKPVFAHFRKPNLFPYEITGRHERKKFEVHLKEMKEIFFTFRTTLLNYL